MAHTDVPIRLVPLQDALELLQDSDLFRNCNKAQLVNLVRTRAPRIAHDCGLSLPSFLYDHVFCLTYRFGDPIVNEDGIHLPPELPGHQDEGIQRAVGLWNDASRLNHIFVIQKGFVEIHYHCDLPGPSVPIIELSAGAFFGELELSLHTPDWNPYHASATAFFRTVHCWKGFANEVLWRQLAGRDVRNDKGRYRNCHFILLQDFLSHLNHCQAADLWVVPHWVIRAAVEHTPVRTNYDKAKQAHEQARVMLDRNIDPSVMAPDERPYDFFNHVVLKACAQGQLPVLVPLSFYPQFQAWLVEFNEMAAGVHPSQQRSKSGGRFRVPYHFYVPRPSSVTDRTRGYEPSPDSAQPWPVLSSEMARKYSKGTLCFVRSSGQSSEKVPDYWRSYRDEFAQCTEHPIGTVQYRLNELRQHRFSANDWARLRQDLALGEDRGAAKLRSDLFILGAPDPVLPWQKCAEPWITHLRRYAGIREHWLDPVVLQLMGNVKECSVLDVGCGEGRFCRLLQRSGARVWGVDISEELIEKAKGNGAGAITFKVADVLSLSENLGGALFPLIVAYLSLNSVPSLLRAFCEMYTVCAPNGVVVVVLPNPLVIVPQGWSPDLLYCGDQGYFEPLDEKCDAAVVNFYRSWETITCEAQKAGFVLEVQIAPPPPGSLDHATAGQIEKIKKARNLPDPYQHPWFVCFRFVKGASDV